jgi:PAS domain-containing protein
MGKIAELEAANVRLKAEVARLKQTETALLASEARFQEVLENSVDASYKRNLQSNCYE